jgi:VWFA-related protein
MAVPAAALTAAVLLLCAPRLAAVHAEGSAEGRAEDRAAFQPAQQQPTAVAPTLKVYSRETIVDVTVTDAKGNPIHGLTRDDFTVKEDGKEQPVKSFAEFSNAVPVRTPPKLPPNIYTNLQPQVGGPLNIALLDFMNIAALPGPPILGAEDSVARGIAAQKAVKASAERYFAGMPPGTRVILLGLSNNLRTLQGETSDPTLLSTAANTLQYNVGGTVATYEQYCAQAEMRARSTIEVLDQIAADLSTIKGKKNLLWFSVGIPWLTNPSAHVKCLPDYSADLLKTYGLLATAQIAVYPIDARGVHTIPNAFITSTGKLWANIPFLGGAARAQAEQDFYQTTAEQQFAMEEWADRTGGAAFYNSNDLAGLMAKALDTGSNYYTLSYVPPGGYNWAHHRIKVEIGKPGLKLVYRQTYDAVDPATIKPAPGLALTAQPKAGPAGPVDMRTEMGRSVPTSQQILFDVQVEPSGEPAKPTDPAVFGVLDVKLKSKPLTRYGFQYAFPGRQIAFTTAADGTRHGSLEFDVAAYGGDGNVVTSLRQAIQLNLTADQVRELATSPFRYFQQLDLPAGGLFLRVGVLDRTANKVGTLEIPVTVAKAPAQHAAVGGR